MTAGSLSATADGLPEADMIPQRRRGGHKTKTPDDVMFPLCSAELSISGRFPHPTGYFR